MAPVKNASKSFLHCSSFGMKPMNQKSEFNARAFDDFEVKSYSQPTAGSVPDVRFIP